MFSNESRNISTLRLAILYALCKYGSPLPYIENNRNELLTLRQKYKYLKCRGDQEINILILENILSDPYVYVYWL